MADSAVGPAARRSSWGFWLSLSLLLCLCSGMGACWVQTAGGAIEVTDMRWETPSGHTLSALLLKPAGATRENPAPAVVVSHGWFNNREMQDLNFIELSRRGYVVVSIDLYGHGNSEVLPQRSLYQRGIGMYDAVELVADLPYVDRTRIGVSGHSNGALAANLSVAEDDRAERPLISAVLLVDRDPVYKDPVTEQFSNVYGTRDVGLIHDHYDEFFFRSVDGDGKVLTPPRDYLKTDNAQSFLHFGAVPGAAAEQRVAGRIYRKTVDEIDAIRIIYSLNQIHPWTHFSAAAARDQISFFGSVFGAPQPIDPSSQVWQIRTAFTFAGLVGFAIFLVAFTGLLTHIAGADGLQPPPAPAPAPRGRAGRVWFWGGLVILAIVSAVSYIGLLPIAFATQPSILPQGATWFVGLWAAVNGVIILLITVLSWLLHGRRSGQDLRAVGVRPGLLTLGQAIALGLVVVFAAFLIVFVVDYFFKTDFRIWVLAIKAFTPDKIGIALLYLPFFLIYFVASSVASNSFNQYSSPRGEWINTTVLAVASGLAPALLVIAQYTTFFQTGYTLSWFPGITSIWLFPIIVLLPVATIISRKIYRVTGSPYVGGIINASVVTMMAASNTLTIA